MNYDKQSYRLILQSDMDQGFEFVDFLTVDLDGDKRRQIILRHDIDCLPPMVLGMARKEIKINNRTPWREKLLRTVQMNYARPPFFEQVFPLFKNLVNNPADRLVDYNEAAIRALVAAVGLDTSRLVISSTLDTAGEATDLLISMTRAVGGTAYLCGGGAEGYQEDDKFAQVGLELIYQNFQHPIYPQINASEFIPGLSIVDDLMNCGIEGTRRLLQQGKGPR